MSRLFIVIGGIVGIVALIAIVVGVFGVGRVPASPAPVTLEMWGIQDDEAAWTKAFQDVKTVLPYITVQYRRLDENTYEETLVNSLAEEKGPDIFMAPHTWVLKHHDKFFPLPQEAMRFSAADFKNAFVEGVSHELISNKGEILGLPLFVDTLSLFYNKDIFNSAGIAEPPSTWDDVAALSRKLTRINPGGDVASGGIALGGSRNVEHSFEILSALMMQKSEIDPASRPLAPIFSQGAEDAMKFYMSFSDPADKNFSWNNAAPDSLDAFAQGKVAMMIGFAGDIARIRARNPHINLGIAPLPQTAGVATSRDWGDYFFPAVSQRSLHKGAAWQFLLALSSRTAAKTYLDATGRAPARRDLVSVGTASEDLAVFWRQSLIASAFLTPDDALTRRFFAAAIDSVVSHASTPAGAIGYLREQARLISP